MSQQTGFITKFTDVVAHPQVYIKEYKRFLKFAIVGAFGAIVDFTIFNLMLYFLRDVWHVEINWQIFGFEINWILLIANTIAVCVAIVSNFTWNRLWTFPESRTRKKRKQLVQFGIVNMVGLILNNLILLVVHILISPTVGDGWLSDNISKAVAIGIVLFWNFGANRLWTYRGL
jgi:putative flippase GtrA